MLKKISIITVCMNSEKTIMRCLKSVHNQNYPKNKIEHIVIDGKSSDKTVSIINKFKKKIKYFESKKDKGIYYAINKALKKCSGDIIGVLNSDDYYYKNTFRIVSKYFMAQKLDFLFGSVNHKRLYHGFYPKKIWYKLNIYPSHSVSFFIKKKTQLQMGFYNTQIKYSSDRDLIYKLIRKNRLGLASRKNEVFGKFNTQGISSKLDKFTTLRDEYKVRYNNKQNSFFIIILLIVRYVYSYLIQLINSKK
jgi:glycosyltransferase involved in cell wall biosynthesis